MPFTVNCPSCGVDGTLSANQVLSQVIPQEPPPLKPALRVSLHEPEAAAPAPTLEPVIPSTLKVPVRPTAAKKPGEFNMGLGTLGAFLGAGLGAGLMVGFAYWTGFRFPWLGLIIGAMTGYGARLLYKGTDIKLGYVSGAIALCGVVGSLYLIYGTFLPIFLLSVAISVYAAYQVASA